MKRTITVAGTTLELIERGDGNPMLFLHAGEGLRVRWIVPPVALAALVITGAGGFTVKVKVAVPVPPALVALKLTFEVAAVVGVPEISPVPVLIDKPAGKPVALKLVGLFVAVI